MQQAEDEELKRMQQAEEWAEEETAKWLDERYTFWKDCEDWADEETKIWLAQHVPADNTVMHMEQNVQGMPVRNTYSVRLFSIFVIKH